MLQLVLSPWPHSSCSADASRVALRTELVDLVPDLTDDLLNTIDQPLQAAKDSQGNTYLNCDYTTVTETPTGLLIDWKAPRQRACLAGYTNYGR